MFSGHPTAGGSLALDIANIRSGLILRNAPGANIGSAVINATVTPASFLMSNAAEPPPAFLAAAGN